MIKHIENLGTCRGCGKTANLYNDNYYYSGLCNLCAVKVLSEWQRNNNGNIQNLNRQWIEQFLGIAKDNYPKTPVEEEL